MGIIAGRRSFQAKTPSRLLKNVGGLSLSGKDRLPVEIDARRLADRGEILSGAQKTGPMARLREQTEGVAEVAEVTLSFGVDAAGCHWMRCEASVGIELTCQRCLEPMPWTLEADEQLALITSDEDAVELADAYEPLVVEGPIRVAELVEDELLLALPLIAKHQTGPCAAQAASTVAEEQPPEQQESATSPFSELAAIKRDADE